MWPRISSGFLALQAGRLDEAERRFRRIVEMPVDAALFRVYRNSAEIGLGLVALARGQIEAAQRLLMAAQADRSNFYPYTYVQALVGLARIEHLRGAIEVRDRWLRKALRFAGERSLLEEYILVLVELAQMNAAGAPMNALIDSVYDYVQSIRLESAIAALEALRARRVAG
jgi:tetratricopeptide (TPR) repeat protein